MNPWPVSDSRPGFLSFDLKAVDLLSEAGVPTTELSVAVRERTHYACTPMHPAPPQRPAGPGPLERLRPLPPRAAAPLHTVLPRRPKASGRAGPSHLGPAQPRALVTKRPGLLLFQEKEGRIDPLLRELKSESQDETALHDIVTRVAEYGGGPEVTYRIPENASIRLDDRHEGSPLLAGATFSVWAEDGE